MVSKAIEFKSKKQIEEIKAFVDGEFQVINAHPVSYSQLSKLSLNELVDRMESVYNQSLLEIWMMCLAIREKFKSDPEMGKFIKTISETNPYHPLCVVKQQTRTNYINAARFCVKHRITNLKAIGMCPTALINLAMPKYRHVADNIFKGLKIENRNHSVAHVTKLIKDELSKEIPTAVEGVLVEKMPYEQDFVLTEQEIEEEPDYIEGSFTSAGSDELKPVDTGYDGDFKRTIKQAQYDTEQVWPQVDRRAMSNDSHMIELSEISSDDLILELASRNEPRSAKERQDEIMLFVERFDASFSELRDDFEALKKRTQKLLAV